MQYYIRTLALACFCVAAEWDSNFGPLQSIGSPDTDDIEGLALVQRAQWYKMKNKFQPDQEHKHNAEAEEEIKPDESMNAPEEKPERSPISYIQFNESELRSANKTIFEAIQKKQSDVEMRQQIVALLQAAGARMLNGTDLDEMVSRYSGTKSKESFRIFWADLLAHDLAPTGSTASLNEAGYLAVAASGSNKQMKQFIKRLIEAEGGTLLRGDPLDDVVPYFSGVADTQSFTTLRKVIHEKEAEGWIKFRKGKVDAGDAAQIEIADPDVDDVEEDEEDEEASSPQMIQTNGEIPSNRSPASSNDDDSVYKDVGAGAAGTAGAAQMHSKGLTKLATKMATMLLQTIKSGIYYVTGIDLDQDASTKSSTESSTESSTKRSERMHTFNEFSFKEVQEMRDTAKMSTYLKRLIKSVGGHAVKPGVLDGFASFYSGERSNGTWSRMLDELIQKRWVTSAERAPLTEKGYASVALHSSNGKMLMFIQRLLKAEGGRVFVQTGLEGMVPFYSGEKATQTLAQMKKELHGKDAAAWVVFDQPKEEKEVRTAALSLISGGLPLTRGKADLKQDAAFNIRWPLSDREAKSAYDNCDTFKGAGFNCNRGLPQRSLIQRWVPEKAIVMEFGSRFGASTCELARKIRNSGGLVAVEPDRSVWRSLVKNLKYHNCHARVVRGAISDVPLRLDVNSSYSTMALPDGLGADVPIYSFNAIEEAADLKVDTLVIDCEGCAHTVLNQIKDKMHQINLVILEADAPGLTDYDTLIKEIKDSGFQMVDHFGDCDKPMNGVKDDIPCFSIVEHYAFKRSLPGYASEEADAV